VALPSVSAVERLGVSSVQVLHPARQCGLCNPEDEVEMRAEEAIGEALPEVCIDDRRKKLQPAAAVSVVAKDLTGMSGVRSNVIDAVWYLNARRSWHRAKVGRHP
jgi:hypothetical protein